MHLLIDVGNTRIKWRLVGSDYNTGDVTHYGELKDLASYIKTLVTEEVRVLLAAVNQTAELTHLLADGNFHSVTVTRSELSQAGLRNSYLHPERMGVDRWLAMVAAFTQIKESGQCKGVIVVDAGSALTIDIVDSAGEHLGGYIVPGLLMAQEALFANTERVIQYNEVTADSQRYDKYKKLGNNTIQCVEYGVINQMLALVKQVKAEYLDYEIFFTGGDGELLAGFIKTGKVDKDLVLKGLWQVRN